jgi:hypothetical protein
MNDDFAQKCEYYSTRMRAAQEARDDSVEGLTAELALAHELIEFLTVHREGTEGPMLVMFNCEIGRMQFVAECVSRALACRQQAAVGSGVITIH